jgi:hypothetical protein
MIQNETFVVEADAARGGTLSRIADKRSGAELLRGPGNELMLQEEYGSHPRWGEGPWLLSPKGPGTGSAGTSAKVTVQRCPLGSRLVAEFSLGDMRISQETLLWDEADRIVFRTHVDGSIGVDRLLRVRFPARVPGGLPVYQGATAVIGRPFGAAGAARGCPPPRRVSCRSGRDGDLRDSRRPALRLNRPRFQRARCADRAGRPGAQPVDRPAAG